MNQIQPPVELHTSSDADDCLGGFRGTLCIVLFIDTVFNVDTNLD
jgi:hypothetical protein